MKLPAIPTAKIQALRAIHIAKPHIQVPHVHAPHVGVPGLGMGGAGHGLSGVGRVQGAPRMNLRIPSFIRKPQL